MGSAPRTLVPARARHADPQNQRLSATPYNAFRQNRHPHQGQESPHFLTWNLGGGCCTGVAKGTHLMNAILSGPQVPIAIAVQEVCEGSSYGYLKQALAYFGYIENTWWQAEPACGTSGPHFGVAVFWLGSCWGGNNCRVGGQFSWSNQAPGDANLRGYACGRGAFPTYFACSAHMTPTSPSKARAQIDEYEVNGALLGFFAKPTMSGDFNRQPGTGFNFQVYNSTWAAADDCWGGCRPTKGSITLDYIFSQSCRTDDEVIVSGSVFSDHEMLVGYFSAC